MQLLSVWPEVRSFSAVESSEESYVIFFIIIILDARIVFLVFLLFRR